MANPNAPSDFSFDLYPGLDSDLEAAYSRNVQQGLAPEADLAGAGLSAVVGNILNSNPNRNIPTDVREWAEAELSEFREGGAILGWMRYSDTGVMVEVPDFVELEDTISNFGMTIERLFHAKQELMSATEETPEDIPIGETMHLALVPWKLFRDHIEGDDITGLETLLRQMRTTQGITEEDYINDDLKAAIANGKPLYKDPATPGSGRWLTAKEYLDIKIEEDGEWGVMLVQTSEQAGVKSLLGRSPDQLTGNGTTGLQIEGTYVDDMGIFEWLALTLQDDPRQISGNTDYSWMLANRLTLDSGGVRVPGGSFDGGQVESYLRSADDGDSDIRPRLAVL